jgi:hypothetical protein
MLCIVMLSVSILYADWLKAAILIALMPNVIMLNVFKLSVVAPFQMLIQPVVQCGKTFFLALTLEQNKLKRFSQISQI